MKRAATLLLALVLLAALPLPGADGWKPIPPGVWAMKEDTAKGWKDERVLPVVLPYLQIFEAESSITLQKGCMPMLPASLEQSNRFGKVVWNAQVHPGEEGTIVQVRLTCAISELMGPPEAQEDLKAWFAWAKEARERTIGLEIRP